MILMCRTSGPDNRDGCDYAVVEVTDALLVRIAEWKAVAEKCGNDVVPNFYQITYWDCTPAYLDDIPEEWEEWVEDHLEEYGVWAELPFPYDPDSATDALDGKTIKMGRTECEMVRTTARDVSWSAIIKYTGITVVTPDFPELTSLEQLALVASVTP